MNEQLFRKEALVRIESPERLNEMVKITTAKSWMVLTAIIAIVISVILWSIFGELPYTVSGQGILQQPGGIIEIAAQAEGRIEKTTVKEGDYVLKGDIIAFIDQPGLKMQIDNGKKELDDFNLRFDKISKFGYENIELKKKLYEKEENNLKKTIKLNSDRLSFIEERITAQEELLENGLITKETLNQTKDEYFNVQQENDRILNQMKELQQLRYEIEEKNEIDLNQLKAEILNIENKIRELEALYNLNSTIISPYSGKIIELMVNPGEVINAGSPILSIEPANINNELQAIIYVDPNEGKKIEKGMEVKLSPSTVEVEEYGYIIGYVEKVSEYPSTFQGMLRTLGNIELVKTFTNNGPPIAVTVLLDDDSTTFSGFRWTSTKGPRLEIKSGTLCSSKIITEKRSPISLLFPKMINKASSIIEESLNKPLPFSENELNKENELVDSVVIINTNSFNENALSIKYTIQIAATKRALTNHDLSLIYTGSEKVREEFINGWYKYSIGIFYSKQEALTYIEENGLQGRAFVKIFNNPN